MRTENSKGIVQLRLLWISTKTRSSVSSREGKLRLVVDMRRSKANARAAVPERPILPRPRDVVADWDELISEAASLAFTSEAGVSCENVTHDFSGAYCHVLVHPEELKNCLVAALPSPSGSDQNIALMCRMGVWFERCATHVVPGRRCSWNCASNAGWRPLVRPRSWPDRHVHPRPPPQLLGTQKQRDKQLQAVLLF